MRNKLTKLSAVTVGSFGEFTGAIAYNGSALFFKEGSIISIYGTEPSNFTLNETNASGIEKGSSKSIANLNGILYYKSKEGIMAYSGGIPVRISDVFGDEIYEYIDWYAETGDITIRDIHHHRK